MPLSGSSSQPPSTDVAGTIQVTRATVNEVDCWRGVNQVGGALPADLLLSVAMDIDGSPRWTTSGVTEARVLSITPTAMTYYQYLDVPNWTFASDRFWFLSAQIRREGARKSLQWVRMPAESPFASVRQDVIKAHPTAIEPPINVGGWYFQPVGNEVMVEYVICSDSGGSMPRLLQNTATRRALPDTIGDLVREARRIGG